MLAKGLAAKEVAGALRMKTDAVNHRVRQQRIKYNCINTTHLIACLVEKGIIDGIAKPVESFKEN